MLEWKLFKIVVGSRNFWNLKIPSRESRGILKKHVFKRLLLPTRAPSQFVVNIYFVPFILGNLLDFYHLGSYFNCYIMFFWNLAKRSTVWRPYFPHMVNIPINFFFLISANNCGLFNILSVWPHKRRFYYPDRSWQLWNSSHDNLARKVVERDGWMSTA